MSVFKRLSEFTNERFNLDESDLFEIEGPTGSPFKLKYSTLVNNLQNKINSQWIVLPKLTVDTGNNEVTVDGTGRVLVDGSIVTPVATTLAYTPIATPGISRIDAVVYNISSATYQILEGTAAATPDVPGIEFQSNYVFFIYIEVSSAGVAFGDEVIAPTNATISNVTLSSVSAAPGDSINITWNETDILSEGGTFGIDAYLNGVRQGAINDPSGNGSRNLATASFIWKIPINRAAGTYTFRVFQTGNESLFADSGNFTLLNPTSGGLSDIQLVAARVKNTAGNKLELEFSGQLSSIREKDFRLNKTFARIIDEDHPDWVPATHEAVETTNGSNYIYTFTLDEFLIPNDRPQVYYWKNGGSAFATADNKRLRTIEEYPVDNQVSTYGGTKSVVLLASTATFSSLKNVIGEGVRIGVARGFRDEGNNTQLSINVPDCKITATGTGDDPYINFVNTSGTYAIRVNNKDNFVIAAHTLVCQDMFGIAFKDTSSFCGAVGCNLIGSFSRARSVGVEMYSQSQVTTARNSGNFAGFNTIDGFNSCITYKMAGISSDWTLRWLGNNQEKIEIYANNLFARDTGSSLGDAVSTDRGDFCNSRVHHNNFLAWFDDGHDMYQAARVFCEYNYFKQSNTTGDPGGGSAIKCGGKGAPNGTTTEATSGYSGELTVRFNHIAGVSAGGQRHAINTNNGGDRNGEIVSVNGSNVTYGKSKVYGNISTAADKHALQIDGADGGDWEFYNNILLAAENGVNVNNCTNMANALFVNNIVQDINGSGLVGENNIFISGSSVLNYTIDTGATRNEQENVDLSQIFTNTADIPNSVVESNSPSIDAGQAVSGYTTDFKGGLVGVSTDIGAYESDSDSGAQSPTNEVAAVYVNIGDLTSVGNQLSITADVEGLDGNIITYTGLDQSLPDATDEGTNRYAEFTINNMQAGAYRISVKMQNNGAADSVYVGMNDLGYYAANGDAGNITDLTWGWTDKAQAGGLAAAYGDPMTFNLPAGTNTFKFLGREQPQVGGFYISALNDTPIG